MTCSNIDPVPSALEAIKVGADIVIELQDGPQDFTVSMPGRPLNNGSLVNVQVVDCSGLVHTCDIAASCVVTFETGVQGTLDLDGLFV